MQARPFPNFMLMPSGDAAPRSTAPSLELGLRLCLIVGVAALVAAIGVTAVMSGFGLLALPYPLAVLDLRLPGIFRLHMAASGLALILLSAAFLVRRHRAVHRIVGRVAAVCLLIGVAASLPSALASEATWVARTGFVAQGLLCLLFLLGALRAIVAGQARQHARFMLRVGAIVAGVVVLRISTFLVARLELPFDQAYAVIAWVSWAAPLAAVWLWQGRRSAV